MTKLIARFLIIFLISLPAAAQIADEQADTEAMRRCQSYTDCALVWGGCSDVAINKRYVNAFKPATACLQSSAHDPKALPTCTDHLCVVVVPDKTK